ncbi:MAG: HlyD family efflux transporter periplasmic adaptor subunit [Sumerlaeia bacterium]
MKFTPAFTALLCTALLLAACDHSHDHAAPMAEEEAAPPTNRVDVPLAVRQNLGITFATVERRAVADTVRYPGVFELKSTARNQYVAPAAGRVEVMVEDYQPVEPGTVLIRVHSPAWSRVKASMSEALLSAEAMRGRLAAHERYHAALQEKLAFWRERLAQLEQLSQAGGGQQAQLADARQNIAATEAEIAEAEENHQELLMEAVPFLGAEGSGEGNPSFDLALNEASVLLGMSEEELLEDVNGEPRWRTIDALEVVATSGGRVGPIPVTTGSLVDNGSLVITVTDPSQLRFRAKALQSDLAKLQEGSVVRVAPLDRSAGETLAGTLAFGLEANSAQRTVDLIINLNETASATWARPGVAGVAEVVIAGGGAMELAVPERAVITDGLQRVLFRRAPDNPNQVIRLEADAGVSDGQWIEILSGLAEGDEVVLGGIYELMLGSSTDGTRQEGGHFHGDGTFHEAH